MTQPPADYYVYSKPQLRALQSVITISGLLSVVGSGLILMHAVQKRRSSIQHRILMGLSAFDLMSSLVYTIFPFAFHSLDRIPGIDCTVETTVKLLGMGAILYNLALSIYYVLCIACLLPEQRIAKCWEPCLHMVCICFPVGWAIAGLALGIANPTAHHIGCHSNPYPRGCDEVGSEIECERGGDGLATIVFMGSTVVPIVFTWAGLLINSSIIVLAVYRQEQKKTRYDPSESSSAVQPLLRNMMCCCRATPQTEWTLSYKMARQALQWVGCFSLTYIMALVMFFISYVDRKGLQQGNYFPILFVMELCWPLQGFFDAIVYFRPKYTLWRTNRSLSCLEALRRTLLSLEPAPTRPLSTPPLAVVKGAAYHDTEESHVQDLTSEAAASA